MLPFLHPGDIVIGTGVYRMLRSGNVVIVDHNGLEKIKRIAKIDGRRVYVLGDNPMASTDSRHFGWLPLTAVSAKVIWPRT